MSQGIELKAIVFVTCSHAKKWFLRISDTVPTLKNPVEKPRCKTKVEKPNLKKLSWKIQYKNPVVKPKLKNQNWKTLLKNPPPPRLTTWFVHVPKVEKASWKSQLKNPVEKPSWKTKLVIRINTWRTQLWIWLFKNCGSSQMNVNIKILNITIWYSLISKNWEIPTPMFHYFEILVLALLNVMNCTLLSRIGITKKSGYVGVILRSHFTAMSMS